MPPNLLHDILSSTASRHPDRTALVVDRRHYTYRWIDSTSDRLARRLTEAGVGRGDRVLLYLENGLYAVIWFWATLKAGAVACPVHPRVRADKLEYCLRHTTASVLIADSSLLRDIDLTRAALASLRLILVSSAPTPDLAETATCFRDWVDAEDQADLDKSSWLGDPEAELAALLFTSGSTGQPKAVMMSHSNMLAANRSLSEYLGYRDDDVVLCALPLSFDYGLYQMIMAFSAGARLVLERPDLPPQMLLARVRAEGVSVFPGIPTLFAMMRRLPALHLQGFERVRCVTSTGAQWSATLITFIEQTFCKAQLYSMFGLTECKRCTYLPPSQLHSKPGSVGIAIPGTELWIADESGRRLPAGAVGELVVRGPTVMRGYWNDPEETTRRLRPGPRPGELVLHTGDLCRLDPDGYLYFVARNDDLIKSRGHRIAPQEIEQKLQELPGVAEVAVVGVPDELLGERIVACVVLVDGSSLTRTCLRAHCVERLEPALVPGQIEFLSGLPRNPTGKVDRRELSRLYSQLPA